MTEYAVNAGVGRVPVLFGVTQKYMMYFLGFVVGSMFLYGVLYALAINLFVCAGSAFALNIGGFFLLQHFSIKYGEHGAIKAAGYSRRPRLLRGESRRVYQALRRGDA